MTILGQHTVAETRDLIRATEFRVNKVIQQWERVRLKRLAPPADDQLQLDKDVATFVNRWTDVRDTQTKLLAASIVSNPNVSPIILPAEKNFVAITDASTRDSPRIGDIQNRVSTEATLLDLPPIDMSGIPSQNSPDADFAALKKLDAAIKAGETTVKETVKSNTGLFIGLGVAGVVGVVVATKVYL